MSEHRPASPTTEELAHPGVHPTHTASTPETSRPVEDPTRPGVVNRETAGAAPPPPPPVQPFVDLTAPTAPPARIAAVAGDPRTPRDYAPGHSSASGQPPSVVPIHAAAADTANPGAIAGLVPRPARDLDAGTAQATLAAMIANLKSWTRDYPHPANGEAADTLTFVRQLAARDEARRNAQAYGQPLDDTPSEFLPPPESATLARLRHMGAEVMEIQTRMLRAGGIQLTAEDQARVDRFQATLEA